jgi:hypothetical protein
MVTELKVSGNLMTLDAGLFCIFNAPGSALPDPATGLPGVRVSLPPGPVFRPEAVTITSFRDDGWLGGWNGAALVRVTRGPAHVLVTIYQAPNSTADAPRLQIMRLAESGALPPLGQPQAVPGAQVPQGMAVRPAALQAANAPAPVAAGPGPRAVPSPAPAANPQNTPAGAGAADGEAAKRAEIVAHIQGRGDVMAKLDEWTGEPDSKRWIEGFAVSPKAAFPGTTVGPADVEYQAVLGRGWLSPWAEGGQYCGSRGMSLPILGLRMRLRGEAAERFDCVVTASFVDGTKVGPLDNGEPCQAESMSPLEAFKITLIDRNAALLQPLPKPDAVVIEAPAPKPAGRRPPAAPVAAEPVAPKQAAPKSAAPQPVVAKASGRAAPAPKSALPGKPAAAPKRGVPPKTDKAQPRGKR